MSSEDRGVTTSQPRKKRVINMRRASAMIIGLLNLGAAGRGLRGDRHDLA